MATGTFKDSFAIFEEFLFGLLRLWLTKYPGSLSDLEVKFARVLHAGSLESLTQELISERLNRRQYKAVRDWFKYVDTQLSLDVPNADQINRIVKIKASRDILEHDQAIVNGEYCRKAGSLARFDVGDRLEIPEHYHRESWTLLRDIVRDMTAAAATKAERAAHGR